MSAVECLREFVSERLTAAAEEIFAVFKTTIVEYEKEIDRQRRLLAIHRKPEIKLRRIELPQQHVCKEEEVLADQQLCKQERSSSLDQEDPEPPQIKEEQEELWTGQEGEQLVLKQETHTSMFTPTEESDPSLDQEDLESPQIEDEFCTSEELEQLLLKLENEPFIWAPKHEKSIPSLDQEDPELPHIKEGQKEPCTSQEGQQLAQKQETGTSMLPPTREEGDHSEPEPTRDQQLLSDNSHVAESQDPKGGTSGGSGSTGDAELRPNEKHESESHSYDGYSSKSSHIFGDLDTDTDERPFRCDRCGEAFRYEYQCKVHLKKHRIDAPYPCKLCIKACKTPSQLKVHMRKHTGERPFPCDFCGKRFQVKGSMKSHRRIHTGERPFPCDFCGRRFRESSALRVHRRIHTGERPYSCDICGKGFRETSSLKSHRRVHRERPQQHVSKEKEVPDQMEMQS